MNTNQTPGVAKILIMVRARDGGENGPSVYFFAHDEAQAERMCDKFGKQFPDYQFSSLTNEEIGKLNLDATITVTANGLEIKETVAAEIPPTPKEVSPDGKYTVGDMLRDEHSDVLAEIVGFKPEGVTLKMPDGTEHFCPEESMKYWLPVQAAITHTPRAAAVKSSAIADSPVHAPVTHRAARKPAASHRPAHRAAPKKTLTKAPQRPAPTPVKSKAKK